MNCLIEDLEDEGGCFEESATREATFVTNCKSLKLQNVYMKTIFLSLMSLD
jgi:hypothetical protein